MSLFKFFTPFQLFVYVFFRPLAPSLTLSFWEEPWSTASLGGNFRRTFRAIGPYRLSLKTIRTLVDVSNIFLVFFCLGEGKGESEAPGRRGFFFMKSQRGEGFSHERGGGARGREGVCAENFGGGS